LSAALNNADIGELVRRLKAKGARFVRDGDQLHVSAPKGAIDRADADFLRSNKQAVLDMLNDSARFSERALPAAARGEDMRLGHLQERMWSHQQMFPELALYNLAIAWRLKGVLNVDALRKALNLVVSRHEILRTRFRDVDGTPTMTFASEARIDMPLSPAPAGAAALMKQLEVLRDAPMALPDGELLRAHLFRVSEDEHVFFFMPHHIVWDGLSWDVFLRDLSAFYEAETTRTTDALPELTHQYADFAAWQHAVLETPTVESELGAWREYYSSETPPLALAADVTRPKLFSYQGAAVEFTIEAAVHREICALAKKNRCTVFTVYMAAWQAFLARMTGNNDVVVGAPAGGRLHEETSDLIGCFVGVIAVRQAYDADVSFSTLLNRMNDNLLGAVERQQAPFGMIVSELDLPLDASRTPLYQAMFSYQDERARTNKLGDVALEMIDIPPGGAPTDIRLEVCETEDRTAGEINYSTDVMTREGAQYFANCFLAFLSDAARRPDTVIGDLTLMVPQERDRVVFEWNLTQKDYARDALAFEYFDAAAISHPEALAVSMGQETLTYGALLARANKIANNLRERGVGESDIVAVYLNRSIDLVAAILGVWKAGAAMLPLDPEFPGDRLAYMARDAKIRMLVTSGLSPDWLDSDVDIFDIAEEASAIAAASAEAPALKRRDSFAHAYVIYTSGSTGTPKGVVNTHRALCNFLEAMMHAPGVAASDRLLAVTTISFDVALLELFVPLSAGAEVVLASDDDAMDGFALADIIEERDITILQGTPATWRILLDAGWKGAPTLKALCGGEAMPAALADALPPRVNVLWNMYGPTETTVWSTCARIVSAADIHVGRPIANTQCYILDDSGQPVPAGVVGDLWIGGDGVALGYLGKPDLTVQRFRDNPFAPEKGRIYNTGDRARRRRDGVIEIAGRRDEQVKIRGYRIELGDIEATLSRHPAVRHAAASVREDQTGEAALVAYVVFNDGETTTGSELRRYMNGRVPAYMTPQFFIPLSTMPLTGNNKVNRKALPAPTGAGPADKRISPRNDNEKKLAAIWSEILKTDDISVADNFFELGGQSLQVTRMTALARKALGFAIPPRAVIFETLEQLAAGASAENV
jgi:amino acid adenylation domain-containing protein